MGTYWVYLVEPLCGAVIALALATAFHGRPTGHEQAAVAALTTPQDNP